ncbi:DinI-like family protein [Serratia marcescens]|nr:DinI-like family protein [Serratia marcescens]
MHSLHRHGEVIEVSEFKNVIGRAGRAYVDVEGIVRLAGMDSLTVRNGTPADRKLIEEVLQETWESADDWFQS